MARPSIPYEVRLQRLEAAKARFKRAKGRKPSTLTAEPMAEALGVSWQTLRSWCNDIDAFEASKCFERGGNGIEWKFRVEKTFDFLTGHFRSMIAVQSAPIRTLNSIAGITMSEDDADISLASQKIHVAKTMALESAKKRQADLVLPSDVVRFVPELNERICDVLLGLRGEQEAPADLPEKVSAQVDSHLRAVATSVNEFAVSFVDSLGLEEDLVSRMELDDFDMSIIDEESARSLDTTKDFVDLGITLFTAAEKAGRYERSQRITAFFARYYEMILDGIMSGRAKIDPNGHLPGTVRSRLEQYLRSVATAVHTEATRFKEGYREGLQQEGAC